MPGRMLNLHLTFQQRGERLHLPPVAECAAPCHATVNRAMHGRMLNHHLALWQTAECLHLPPNVQHHTQPRRSGACMGACAAIIYPSSKGEGACTYRLARSACSNMPKCGDRSHAWAHAQPAPNPLAESACAYRLMRSVQPYAMPW